MELLQNLMLGFSVALSWNNILYCLVGCLLGTLIGVLPGIGPIATISMLLPATFVLPPVSALIMLAGIYYGAQYGGSTTAILVDLPGEVSSVGTRLDGYQMARKGQAGKSGSGPTIFPGLNRPFGSNLSFTSSKAFTSALPNMNSWNSERTMPSPCSPECEPL